MSARHLSPDSPALLALLAALVALGPLSIDMYLPGMPAMARALGADMGDMQLTISSYLAGFAGCHLVCGPLSDRYGRKPILLLGTLIFIAASLGCAAATTLEELVFYRGVQGIGACVGPTLARAATRDIFGPTRAARALSYIAMLMALAPAVAPLIGGFMLTWLPWPSLFYALVVYAVIMLPLIGRYLPESLPAPQSLHPARILANYGELLRHPLFLLVTLGSACIYAGLMSYLGASSLIFIELLGVPVQYFGLIFLTTVLGYMAGSFLSARLNRRRNAEQIALIGAATCCVAALCLVLATSWLGLHVATIAGPVSLYSTGMGLLLPNAMAAALRPFPHIAGTASSLMGFIQMGLSSLVAAVMGSFLQSSATPMLVTIITLSLFSVLLVSLFYRRFLRLPALA